MTKENGLQAIEAFCVSQLEMVARMSAPYLTRRMIVDTVTRALAEVEEEERVSADVLSAVLKVSRAQVYRDRRKDEPDQYSVIQRIADYLCPLYPEWRSASEIFGRVAPYEDALSTSLFQGLLKYYVKREYLEERDGLYRVRGSLVWFDRDVSSKLRRVKRYSPYVADSLLGYLLGKEHHGLHAIGVYTTKEEFEELIVGLRDYIKSWLAERSSGIFPNEQGFFVTILTSTQDLLEKLERWADEGDR